MAAIAEIVSEVHDVMKLKLGNLGPRKQATVSLVYLELLQISANHYWKFSIGNTFSSRSLGNVSTSTDMQNVANPTVTKEPAYLCDIKIDIYTTSAIAEILSTSHSDTISIQQMVDSRTNY